jgi:hypothetical protein
LSRARRQAEYKNPLPFPAVGLATTKICNALANSEEFAPGEIDSARGGRFLDGVVAGVLARFSLSSIELDPALE